MNHVKKVLVYFLYFDGAINRASRGDSGFAGHGAARSEERRVGKECRY